MADIFLSYAHEDRECAKCFAAALSIRGWEVWWDRKIDIGDDFYECIASEVEQARCIVVLWSQFSVASGFVRDEATAAEKRGILVPICIENVQPPMGFRQLQTAELFDWRDALEGAAFQHCLQAIERFAPRSTPKEKEAPADGVDVPAQRKTAGEKPARRGKVRTVFMAAGMILAGMVGLLFILVLMAGPNESNPATATQATTTAATATKTIEAAVIPSSAPRRAVALSLENCYDQEIGVAIAAFEANQWVSSGWYRVPANSTSSDAMTVSGSLVYFYADDERWDGDGDRSKTRTFPVDFKKQKFEGPVQQIEGEDVRAVTFFGRKIKPRHETYLQQFGCK